MYWNFASPLVGSALGASFYSIAFHKKHSIRFKIINASLSSALTFLTALAIKTFNASFYATKEFVVGRVVLLQ